MCAASVASAGDDMVLGIEAGALRDGGAMVTFTACPFTRDDPDEREGQPAPTRKIRSTTSGANSSRRSARRSACANGLVTAADGALVLTSQCAFPGISASG
jgi:hypothetical protein